MTKAVVIPFHQYTPFGREFYMSLFNKFVENLKLWKDEFDTLYIIDSLYYFTPEEKKSITDIKPETVFLDRELEGHHWVQYKWILPKVKEDAILFLDNDVIIYKKGVIKSWFDKIAEYDFVGSFDSSGEHGEEIWKKYPVMEKMNAVRMGSYYFILTKDLMSKIGDDYTFEPLPQEGFDSFGKFTMQMLETNPKIWEIVDDRSSIYFDGMKKPEKGLDLGYYHIRAGSTPAYLLSCRNSEEYQKPYWEYLENQPKYEYLRQMAWYQYLGGDPWEIVSDAGHGEEISRADWNFYFNNFKKYHNLPEERYE